MEPDREKTVVVSQPMYFPWRGMLEQAAIAGTFVHYDEADFPQGRSFCSRVQIKTAAGSRWLTVPVVGSSRRKILDAKIDESRDWRQRHAATLKHAYAKAPFFEEMMALFDEVTGTPTVSLSEMNIRSIEAAAARLGLVTRFVKSSELSATGSGSRRLLDICLELGATTYVTGHGALNYLDHELFEKNGVAVRYMDYPRSPYPQLHGPFDPHVSVLDLIANTGPAAAGHLEPRSLPWKEAMEKFGIV